MNATARGCPDFDWLTARDGRCGRCHRDPWRHDYMVTANPAPHGPPLLRQPWPATLIEEWADRGHITPDRAARLYAITPPAAPTATPRGTR